MSVPKMDDVNDPGQNGNIARRLITASQRNDTLAQTGTKGQAEGYGTNQVPPPGAGFGQTGLIRPAPTLAPVPSPASTRRPDDGSSMDLGLYIRVMWRFKWVMAIGLIIGVGGAYMLYTGVGGGSYASRAQIFITQPGFTWGSNGHLQPTSPST